MMSISLFSQFMNKTVFAFTATQKSESILITCLHNTLKIKSLNRICFSARFVWQMQGLNWQLFKEIHVLDQR